MSNQPSTQNVAITNEIIKEMTGLNNLLFPIPNRLEMNEAERLLSRMATMRQMLVYVATGQHVKSHLQNNNQKADKLNSAWWKQFNHIMQHAAGRYSKNVKYYAAATQLILRPGDDELVQAGDIAATSRHALCTQIALLMNALFPDADHQYFDAAIKDMPEYVRKKKHPKFSYAPDLTPEEAATIKKICEGVLPIFEKNSTRDARDIVAEYVLITYAGYEPPQENPVEEESSFPPPTNFATLGNRIFDISDRQYQFALSVRPESDASVLPVPADIMERLKFDEKTGQLSVTDETNEALSTLSGRLESWTSKEKVTASDFMFLRTALTALYKNPEFINADRVTIKRSELGKHMGADLSAGNAVDVLARLKPLEKLIGRTPDGSIYRVFTFLKYDSASDSYSFACPFINQVILRLEDKNQVEYKTKTKGITASYKTPHINFLLHSTLHKERNKRAVEIVMALTNLFLQRAGETTRKPTGRDRFDVHIKYRTLISYCPLLAASLEDCPDMANKNRILKSAFSKAATLLKEQTDAYTYFENLRISDMIVTNKTLDEVINASFTGIRHTD